MKLAPQVSCHGNLYLAHIDSSTFLVTIANLSAEDIPRHGKTSYKLRVGLAKYLLRCPYLHYTTFADNSNPVPQSHRFLKVMSYMNNSHIQAFVYTPKFMLYIFPGLRVEGAQRLVEKQHLRLNAQRPSQGYFLALTTTQGRRLPLQKMRDVQKLHQPFKRSLNFLPRLSPQLQAKNDVLLHRKMREKDIVLIHNTDAPFLRLKIGDFLSV